MLGHIYIMRLKCILRDKATMFWTFLFPLALATFFFLAFSNLRSAELFTEINIAVVENAQSQETVALKETLTGISNGGDAADQNLFNVTYTQVKSDAERLLADDKVKGYIYYEDGFKLVVKNNGLQQTVIKSFLDDFEQTTSTIGTILETNPAAAGGSLFEDITAREEFLKEVPAGRANPDTTVNYFYALIAMTSFYGAFLGVKEITAIQANQSPQGARVSVAPTHKMKVFAASLCSAVTIQLLETALLILYMQFALGVNFGDQLGYIAITCIAGAFCGVTFGTCITAAIRGKEGLKIGITISFSMAMSFFSGLQYAQMKTIVQNNFPILAYLNPLNLIADSFYALYYYTTHTRYFTNLIILCGFTVVFGLVTYLILRRQKYASL